MLVKHKPILPKYDSTVSGGISVEMSMLIAKAGEAVLGPGATKGLEPSTILKKMIKQHTGEEV